MPENNKINLDAFLQRNSHGNEKVQENKPAVAPIQKEIKSENPLSEEKMPSISTQAPANKTEIKTEIVNTEEVSKKKAAIHNISLDGIKSRRKEEIQEDDEIQRQLESVHAEVNTQNSPELETSSKQEDGELFGNYESRFSNQGAEILKKLRMPKTRIGMLCSLCVISVAIIGTLMYTDPKTHSISNYKASIKTIYSDIKKGKVENKKSGPTGIATTLETPLNQALPTVSNENQESPVVIKAEDKEIDTPIGKEQIKEENLKNFLLENYK